jgi:hypothetical protein
MFVKKAARAHGEIVTAPLLLGRTDCGRVLTLATELWTELTIGARYKNISGNSRSI